MERRRLVGVMTRAGQRRALHDSALPRVMSSAAFPAARVTPPRPLAEHHARGDRDRIGVVDAVHWDRNDVGAGIEQRRRQALVLTPEEEYDVIRQGCLPQRPARVVLLDS